MLSAPADPQPLTYAPRTKLGHVPELDGLRGCAALAVFVLHLFITVRDVPHQTVPAALRPVLQIADLGSYGVDVFFVLSGFLITSLLLLDRGDPFFFRNFYWKRVLRIQPVYMLHLLAAWFLLPGSHGYVLLALIFLVNFDGLLHIPDVGPAWTLSIEEQFYLLWPQVVRRVSIANIYRTAAGLIAFSLTARLGMALVAGHLATRYTFYRLDGLGPGALLACQWIDERSAPPGIVRLLGLLHTPPPLWAAAAYELWSALYPWRSLPALTLFTTNFLVYRLIRYILLHPRARSTAWLRSAVLIFFGNISYSLYMFHTVLFSLYDRYVGHPSFHPKPFFLRLLVVSAATLLICVLTRRLVELPALKLRRFVLR